MVLGDMVLGDMVQISETGCGVVTRSGRGQRNGREERE
jgi:hypothetical protein